MPLYEIHHSAPLTDSERDSLAQSITHLHTRKFTTPSLFVNVRFIDASAEHNYIAGKKRAINRIVAYVRGGGPRSAADFDDLAQQVQGTWDRIVNPDDIKDKQLNRVLVMSAIAAGVESGIVLPRAGMDVGWLEENRPKFEELAAGGDDDFVGLVEELKTREDLGGK
ncbi:hypothetical protein BJY01DRAFT_246233 [Aspergillus pseudoustus]|uniref:Tautomerase cis-CaaD-like domain-containing protein n=1 Tax=Aspergillus pseudoustus TaxID=1810923 RepID=A0ABR4K989_9EURO